MELKQRFNSRKRTNESVFMNRKDDKASIILVVEDVHETRDGIEKLLNADGYRVALAKDEEDAAESAQRQRPDLILVVWLAYKVKLLSPRVVSANVRTLERMYRLWSFALQGSAKAMKSRSAKMCMSLGPTTSIN